MPLNLSQEPFSFRGSRIAITERADGICLKTIYAHAKDTLVAKLIPLRGGQPAAFACEARPEELLLRAEGGAVHICFAEENILLIKGTGSIGLRMEGLAGPGNSEYVHALHYDGRPCYMINVNKNQTRYVLCPMAGTATRVRDAEGKVTAMDLLPEGDDRDRFLIALEEVRVEWQKRAYDFDYDICRNRALESFEGFYHAMPKGPKRLECARELASYVNWSGFVRAGGNFTRGAMLMSKNRMTAVWSWDHCFNAIALARADPRAAWDQYMLPFDYQDPSGRLPDCVNDAFCQWSYCKPPIHGWALNKLMERMELGPERELEAYEKLSRWTRWWLEYRDSDGDGVCEYWHGKDSGWDNATAFALRQPMETPDLSAFLVLQMDALAELAERLGKPQQARDWRERADATLAAMARHCYDEEGNPLARASGTHEIAENDCLLLYMPVVLGPRLPEPLLRRTVEGLKSGRFLTPHGLATESPASAAYEADGYWRGPIWAPVTMLIIDGLAKAGERVYARDLAERFCDMAAKSGFAENFDALTGEGLRDRAYTWTASVYLLLAEEL